VNVISAPSVPWVAPPKLYRIGEVVRYSGFSRQTIHNYTTMGLIREQERTDGGHRMYGEDVFAALAIIKSLKGKRTLAEIRQVLMTRQMLDDATAKSETSDSESEKQ
jgi:DNA-binding transcriptional MerR regulator